MDADSDTTLVHVFSWPYDAKTSVCLASNLDSWAPKPICPQPDRVWATTMTFTTQQVKNNPVFLYKFIVDDGKQPLLQARQIVSSSHH